MAKYALINILFLYLLRSCAFSSEVQLAVFRSDINTDYYQLSANISDENNEIHSFILNQFKKNNDNQKEIINVDEFIKNGVKLPKNGKFSIAKINVENFDRQLGGFIKIDTLYNLLENKRKKYEFRLSIEKNLMAMLFEEHQIKEVFIQTNKIPIIGIVGIKNLKITY